MFSQFKKYFHLYFLGGLFLLNFFVWYAVLAEERNGILTVSVFDIGQGDAIFIETPNGNQILVDGGPDNKVLRQLGKTMPFYDRSVDMLIVSNPDKDHIAGLIDVLRRYKVARVIEPGTFSETAAYRELGNEIEKEKAEKVLARRGMRLVLDRENGIFLDILFPDRDVSGLSTNDGSIVAKLVYGAISFLLTGDSPKAVESYLVSLDGKNLRSNVLKVGHHGSKTSTGKEFLGYVSPEYAAISSGKNNKYRHPHKEVTELFQKFNIPYWNTAAGTTVFKSDGEKVFVESENNPELAQQ